MASSLNSCTARWRSVAFAVVSVAIVVSFRVVPRSFVPCRLPVELLVRPFLQLAEHVVEIEAGGLLALRVLSEGGEEFPDVSLRWHQQKDVIDEPIVVGH